MHAFARFPSVSVVAAFMLSGAISYLSASAVCSKAPVITEHPKNIKVKEGAEAVFSVKATGENLSYQWYLNDVKQKNSNDKEVKLAKVKNDHNGAKIYVVVSNPFGADTSKEAVVTVESSPSTPTIKEFYAVPNSIKVGESAKLKGIYFDGKGEIEPGCMLIESSKSIEVSPKSDTTYTLTVTAPDGKTVTATAKIHVCPKLKDDVEEMESTEDDLLKSVPE